MAKAGGSKGRPVRLVDTTSVAKAGRDAYESGGRWRVHSVFDLASERFTAFEVTEETESEVLDRADVVPGEIRVGDRAYLQPDRITKVLDGGGDVVVRARWNGARWLDGDGARVELIPLLQKARGKGLIDQPIFHRGLGRRANEIALGGDPQAQAAARPHDREAQAQGAQQVPHATAPDADRSRMGHHRDLARS
jgi:hypothetical protein